MPELLFHYIWQQAYFACYPQFTTDGRRVEVVDVGVHNVHAGPDFSNVRLRIYPNEPNSGQPIEWVGNIELHLRSSDWYRHRHHLDPAYDSVILHVVRIADREVMNTQGQTIPQLELQYPFGQDYVADYLAYAKGMDTIAAQIPCSHSLLSDPELITSEWRVRLLRKRFECKRSSIHKLLALQDQSWEDAFYISLARNFGFHTNAVPFELLAMQTPLSCLRKHRDHPDQLRAMILGQSGLLSEDDPLYAEYEFLRRKFSLTPIEKSLWKHSRMRPQNAPLVRLNQFIKLMSECEWLFSRCLTVSSVVDLVALFRDTEIGISSIRLLLINTVLPYRYAWAMAHRDAAMAAASLELMSEIPAEDNSIIRQWQKLGQKVDSAADSQALIHLYQSFCQQEGCLNCEVAFYAFECHDNLKQKIR